eukprot:9424661-Prorocentrum_lima.AAC.1
MTSSLVGSEMCIRDRKSTPRHLKLRADFLVADLSPVLVRFMDTVRRLHHVQEPSSKYLIRVVDHHRSAKDNVAPSP